MKLTIIIPDEMKLKLNAYILKRFGNQKPRATSLVMREALNDFLLKQEKREAEGRE